MSHRISQAEGKEAYYMIKLYDGGVYLVNGTEAATKAAAKEQSQLRLYRKHSEIIQKCERLSSEKEKLLVAVASYFGEG